MSNQDKYNNYFLNNKTFCYFLKIFAQMYCPTKARGRSNQGEFWGRIGTCLRQLKIK